MFLLITLTFVIVSCPFARAQQSIWNAMVQAPQPILDVVAISQGTGLKGLAANWVVLVVLDAPRYPSVLKDRIAQVKFSFGPIMATYKISQSVQDSWRHRLNQLETVHVLLIDKNGRVKRGLLNLGGAILHVLFGTVTNKQMQKYQKVLYTMGSKLNAVIHFQSDLITAVNQSRMYIQENRDEITQLEMHQVVVDTFLRKVNVALNVTNRRVGALEIQVEMERIISALEVAYQQYQDRVSLYHTHRASLEMGRLTEDLLPPKVLMDVLHQAAQEGYDYVSQIEWYYQYISVEPIWQEGQNLVYRVTIPLFDKQSYLLYSVHTFPNPIPNSSFSVKVQLENQYGLDTNTGGLFVPSNCLGYNPTVCTVGPIYDSNVLQCPRGLVTTQKVLLDYCKVNVIKDNNVTKHFQFDVNTYIISTWGEQIILRCKGKPSQYFHVTHGVYNITCIAGCSFSGANWKVNCMYVFHMRKTIQQPTLSLPALVLVNGYRVPTSGYLRCPPDGAGR